VSVRVRLLALALALALACAALGLPTTAGGQPGSLAFGACSAARASTTRGRLAPASVSEAALLRLLSGLDLAQSTRELAPAAIAAAAHGDAAPLARLTHALGPGSPGSDLPSPSPASLLAAPDPGLLDAESRRGQGARKRRGDLVRAVAATYCDERTAVVAGLASRCAQGHVAQVARRAARRRHRAVQARHRRRLVRAGALPGLARHGARAALPDGRIRHAPR
jgi:hypothetical protein